MPEYTKTQGRYLSFIHAYTERAGEPPSMQDIASALGVSSPSVNGMLKTLEKNGFIARTAGETRSIKVLVDSAEIPPWKKKINVKLEFWVPTNASPQAIDKIADQIINRRKSERLLEKLNSRIQQRRSAGEDLHVFTFKITLLQVKPTIWRRIETLDGTLAEFHRIIQSAMGWTNSHLHAFVIGCEQFVDAEMIDDDRGATDYHDIRIRDLVRKFGDKLKMKYQYDFGDCWEHTISIEKVLPAAPLGIAYPRCVAGKNACPPEDIGGPPGFAMYLEALDDPKHPAHKEMLEYYGPFNSAHFDVEVATRNMQLSIA